MPIYQPPSEDPAVVKRFNRSRIQPCEYYYELLIDFFSVDQLQEMLIHYLLHSKEPPSKRVKITAYPKMS